MQKDEVVRALTADRKVRVVVVRALGAVAGVDAAHDVAPEDRRRLGELVLAAVLVRETMARNNRLQMTLRSEEGSLFADSFPGGMTRGMAGGGRVTGNLRVHVARVTPDGNYSDGLVEVHSPNISQAVGEYIRVSEQVETVIHVVCEFDENGVTTALGILAQLLPGGESEDLSNVGDRVGDDWKGLDAEQLARRLAKGGMVLSHDPVFFGCTCSEERVMGALLSVGREELDKIIETEEVLNIDCEYCGENYEILPEYLEAFLLTLNQEKN